MPTLIFSGFCCILLVIMQLFKPRRMKNKLCCRPVRILIETSFSHLGLWKRKHETGCRGVRSRKDLFIRGESRNTGPWSEYNPRAPRFKIVTNPFPFLFLLKTTSQSIRLAWERNIFTGQIGISRAQVARFSPLRFSCDPSYSTFSRALEVDREIK